MKKLKKKLLCIMLISALVLTGCSGGSPTDDGEDEVPKDQYEILVMNQYGECVSGADVSIAGGTYATNDHGTIKLDKLEAGDYAVSVKCDKYYDYNGTYSINEGEHSGQITIKAAELSSHRLQSAIYKRGLGTVDLVDKYKKVNKGTAGWKFSITATVCSDAASVTQYKLFQETEGEPKEIASSTTGKFENININDFSVGTGVYITVYDVNGLSISTSLRLEIAEDPNYSEHSEISLGSEKKLTVSDDVPIFGGTEINFGFPSIPLSYKNSGDKVQIGFNVNDDTFNDDEKRKEYKKMLNEVKEKSANMKKAVEQLKKEQKKKGIMGMAGFEKGVEVSVSGYAETGVNSDGTLSTGTGYLCITAEASANFDWQFVVWIVPVTVGIEGKIEADFADTITYDFNANKLQGDSSLTIKPSLEVKAGVGFKYLNGGVYGSAGLETKLIIASLSEEPGFSYLDLNSSVGVYADIAWFQPKHDIAKGTFHLWARDNNKMYTQSANESSKGIMQFSELYDLKNYRLSQKADKVKLRTNSSGDKTVLASGINPAAEPVSVSNGKDALSVYTVRETVDGRDYTAPKLYYNTYTRENGEGSWSEAKKIDQSESDSNEVRSEMNQKLCTDGKDYYLVYQDVSTSADTLQNFADASTELERDSILKNMWKNVDLHVKKYDTANKTWIDYGKINTSGTFDYNADIIVHNGKVYVCSATNQEGDYFGTDTGKNYINIASCDVSNVSGTKNWTVNDVSDNLRSITSVAAGIKNGKIACEYTVDFDNDLSTDKQEVKLYTDDNRTNVDVYTGSAAMAGYEHINGSAESFIITSNNMIAYLKGDNTVEKIDDGIGSYDGIYSITDKGIYYTKNTENGTEIYVKYKAADGTYGGPVQITEEDGWMKNVSVVTVDGKDYVTALSNEYDSEGDEGVTDSRIDVFEMEDSYDLNIEEANYDIKNSLTDPDLPVTVKLKNEGTKTIPYVKMKVKDADGNEVLQKTEYYTVNINPGNEKEIVLDLSGVDSAEFGEWSISADIVASIPEKTEPSEDDMTSPLPEETETDDEENDDEPEVVEEKTLDNNTTQLDLGNSDFVIRTQMCDSGAYPYMLVEVKNEGNRTDSASLNLYNANNVSEEYGDRDISNLEPGNGKMFKINVKDDWVDDSGKVAVLARVDGASHELYTYNNYDYQYATMNYGKFTITYNLNGGVNNSSNPSTYTTADTISFKDPTKTGYIFEGWYTSSNFDVVSKISGITAGNAQDITVYAKWKKKESNKTEDKSQTKPTTTNKNTNNSGTKKVKLLNKGAVKKLAKYNARVKITKPGKIVNNRIIGGEVRYLSPIKNKTSISVPGSVKIGKYSYKVKSIADNAFKNKRNMKEISIGKNIVSIGKKAFMGDGNLRKITVKSKVLKSVGKNALKGINKNAVIKVPKSKYKKYKKLFGKKVKLQK